MKDLSWVIHCIRKHIFKALNIPFCIYCSVRGGSQILIHSLTFFLSFHPQAVYISVRTGTQLCKTACKGACRVELFHLGTRPPSTNGHPQQNQGCLNKKGDNCLLSGQLRIRNVVWDADGTFVKTQRPTESKVAPRVCGPAHILRGSAWFGPYFWLWLLLNICPHYLQDFRFLSMPCFFLYGSSTY